VLGLWIVLFDAEDAEVSQRTQRKAIAARFITGSRDSKRTKATRENGKEMQAR
jgi:hypothetical protein